MLDNQYPYTSLFINYWYCYNLLPEEFVENQLVNTLQAKFSFYRSRRPNNTAFSIDDLCHLNAKYAELKASNFITDYVHDYVFDLDEKKDILTLVYNVFMRSRQIKIEIDTSIKSFYELNKLYHKAHQSFKT